MPRRKRGFPSSGGLDSTDRNILDFFRGYQIQHGRPPSIREIQHNIRELNSTSAVKYRLDKLVRLGRLRRFQGSGRSARAYYLPLETRSEPATHPVLPILGYITASGQETIVYNDAMREGWKPGIPLDPAYVEGWVELESLEGLHFDDKRYFALQVKGSSMEDRHIFDGDIVVFRHTEEPPPIRGKLVAVYVEGDEWLTLKEFNGVRNGYVILNPANRAEGLTPIQVPAEQARFQGLAVLVIRQLDDGGLTAHRPDLQGPAV